MGATLRPVRGPFDLSTRSASGRQLHGSYDVIIIPNQARAKVWCMNRGASEREAVIPSRSVQESGMYGESDDITEGWARRVVEFRKFVEAGGVMVTLARPARSGEFGITRDVEATGQSGVLRARPIVQAEILRPPVRFSTVHGKDDSGAMANGPLLQLRRRIAKGGPDAFPRGDASVMSGLMRGANGSAIVRVVDVPVGNAGVLFATNPLPVAEFRRVNMLFTR